jgi:hypothetical protein
MVNAFGAICRTNVWRFVPRTYASLYCVLIAAVSVRVWLFLLVDLMSQIETPERARRHGGRAVSRDVTGGRFAAMSPD